MLGRKRARGSLAMNADALHCTIDLMVLVFRNIVTHIVNHAETLLRRNVQHFRQHINCEIAHGETIHPGEISGARHGGEIANTFIAL